MILSNGRKIQVIADLLSGQSPDIDPADLDAPWIDYYNWIMRYRREEGTIDLDHLRLAFSSEITALNFTEEDVDHLRNYRLILQAMETPTIYKPVDDELADIPDLEWLWPNWIPQGMISILAAAAGTGKSYFCLDLARRIINSSEFPDGMPIKKQGPVLYVDAENTPSLYKQRLEIWSPYERQRLFYMRTNPARFALNLDTEDDRERFLDRICALRPILTVIDSYGSATLRGERKKEDVQSLLSYLSTVATDYRLAMLLVHHLRKSVGENQANDRPLTLDAVKGSSFITQLARNVVAMQFARYWDKNGPRRLWVLKSNPGIYPEALGVIFKSHPQNPAIAQLEYDAPPEVQEENTKTEECQVWLVNLLREAGEPVKPKIILEIAERDGFNQRMVHRARNNLGSRVVDTENRFNPDNCWRLVDADDGIEEVSADSEPDS